MARPAPRRPGSNPSEARKDPSPADPRARDAGLGLAVTRIHCAAYSDRHRMPYDGTGTASDAHDQSICTARRSNPYLVLARLSYVNRMEFDTISRPGKPQNSAPHVKNAILSSAIVGTSRARSRNRLRLSQLVSAIKGIRDMRLHELHGRRFDYPARDPRKSDH